MNRYLLTLFLTILALQPMYAEISEVFKNPDDFNAKPWCFWYWMHGAVTKEGITTDLEAMKQNGLGGTYLMPIKSIEMNPGLGGTVRQLSPQWYEMVDWAMQEADRLGLKLGMHICDGFALAGGPWITPEESMQKVVMTAVNDTIGTTIGYYSIPFKYLKGEQFFESVPSTKPDPESISNAVVSGEGEDLKIDTLKGSFSAKKPFVIEYKFPKSITVSALELILPATQFQAQRMDVYASADGLNFEHVKQLVPARTGWQNYDFNTTHAIPTTQARIWRFTWTPEGSPVGSEDLDQAKWSPSLKVNEIRFHAAPRINQWEGKAGLVWRISSTEQNTVADEDYIPLSQIREYASSFSIPEKDKTRFCFRLASVSTGQVNATGGDGRGLECDKFNRSAIQKQLNNWFNSHFFAPVRGRDSVEHLNLARRVLKYMHVDSWECGSQNWSSNFADEFKARRGYSIIDYLPLLVGFPVVNEETSERVLRDVRLTINELIEDIFFDELRQNAQKMGCQLSAENVCPTMVSDGMAHFRYADLPMGEFWLNSPTHDKINDMLDAISGAHAYGKRIIQAEGCTELRGVFDEDPAMVKPLINRNFCLGINRLFYHVYCLNPNPLLRPGMTLDGIGFFFQKGNTWFDEASELTKYVTRCQYLLQMGRPVVDIAVFTGCEMPRRAFQPDRLVSMLPGIFGPERVASEKERLANVGVPVIERPVGVKFVKNTLTSEDWINPLHGYQYDSFNEDALVRCKSDNGQFFVEAEEDASPRYRLLVLPTAHPMDPDGLSLGDSAQIKIDKLQNQGVKVISSKDFPWNEPTFEALGVNRDVNYLPEGIAYCHRTSSFAEIYFLSNQMNEFAVIRPEFRDSKGRTPELWNPLDGTIRLMGEEIVLQPYASIFVVFPTSPTPDELLSPAFEHEKKPVKLACIDSKWSLHFLDTNVELESDTLPDWSKSDDPFVRYYSGHVSYSTSFDLDSLLITNHFEVDSIFSNTNNLYLVLNDIKNLATVTLNGKDCGIAWTAPYEVNISDAIQPGENRLVLEVVNTWSNAIQGHDEGMDPFPNIWTNARYRKKSPQLLPAGLFGPVEIVLK